MIELPLNAIPEDLRKYFRPKRKYGAWTLRNVIIWHKKNCMPSSVKDRVTVDFEPVLMFSKAKKYFFDINAIREPHKTESIRRAARGRASEKLDAGEYATSYKEEYKGYDDLQGKLERGELRSVHPNGRAPRTVWDINTQPFAADHIAKYPEELCRRPILAGCPERVCKKCGKPRERIVKVNYIDDGPNRSSKKADWTIAGKSQFAAFNQSDRALIRNDETVGFSDCGCNAGWEKGVVLDPFAGVGTTCKVAKKYGRSYIGFEIKKEYCEIAEQYLTGATNWMFKEGKKNTILTAFG